MYVRIRRLLNWLWIGKVLQSDSAGSATHVDIKIYHEVLADADHQVQLARSKASHLSAQLEELKNRVGGLEWEVSQLRAELEHSEKLWTHWRDVAVAAQDGQKRAQKIRLVPIHHTYYCFQDVPLDVPAGDIQAAVNAAWEAIRELDGGPGDIIQNEFGMWKVSVRFAVPET